MQTELKVKNIVFAGVFDLSIFDKYFFIKNEILKEEDILIGSVFNKDDTIQVLTENFQIIINGIQLVIINTKPQSNQNYIQDIALVIINTVDVRSLQALGLNFNWFLEDNSIPFNKLSKQLFYNDKIELFAKFFDSDDSMFGSYASTNVKDGRLKLDIKPITMVNLDGTSQNVINFVFNFHFDNKGTENNSNIAKWVNDYSFYENEGKRLMSIYKSN